jgi:ubiquitin carboxyl-terminal hydrolase 9/24
MSQLQERLDFLNFCIINAPLTLSLAQLDVLWDCCVVSPCCTAEEDQVFRWLEQARMNSAYALDMEATRHLFGRFAMTELEALTPTGYSCVEYFFRWINWKEQRFVQQDTTSFLVLDLPLFGSETLWQVALRARDADVGRRLSVS